MDVLDTNKFKHLICKPWSNWSLPDTPDERECFARKEAGKRRDKSSDKSFNLLPGAYTKLYGKRPEVEFFSVSKCAGCHLNYKTQWLARHFKRDRENNLVCRQTEIIVTGPRAGEKVPSHHLVELPDSMKGGEPLSPFTEFLHPGRVPKKSKSSKPTSTYWGKSKSSKSYTLSIPGDDSGKATAHYEISLGKNEPEYEQLKFYADSSHELKKKDQFKIPLKSKVTPKPSPPSYSIFSPPAKSTVGLALKKLPTPTAALTTKEHKPVISTLAIPSVPSAKSSGISQLLSKPTTTVSSTGPALGPQSPPVVPKPKKKKKKRSKDEPRKVIPLKDRNFHPDLHCGVCEKADSDPCTRSLTCKTHSIALRRAVPGRSQSFDALLATHKKAKEEERAKIKEQESVAAASSNVANTPVPTPRPTPVVTVSTAVQPPKAKVRKVTHATDVHSATKIVSEPPSQTTTTLPSRTLSQTSRSVNQPKSASQVVTRPSSHHQPSRLVKEKKVTATAPPAPERKGTNQFSTSKASSPSVTRSKSIVANSTTAPPPPRSRRDHPGVSYTDIPRDFENNFIRLQKVMRERHDPRFNALSEWNVQNETPEVEEPVTRSKGKVKTPLFTPPYESRTKPVKRLHRPVELFEKAPVKVSTRPRTASTRAQGGKQTRP